LKNISNGELKMDFKNIVLIYKTNLQPCLFEKIERIKKIFSNSNFLVVEYNSIKKELLRNADLVLTIGGDGTFVKAAHLIEDSLILGINSNPKTSEGALTSISIDEIDKLNCLNNSPVEVLERQRADVFLNNKLLEEKAINDIFIGARFQFHASRYVLLFNNMEEEQRSSGIVICTGTGSTAWFKSAGGKPFNCNDKKLSFIVREPYYGERIFVPKIFGGDILEDGKLIVKSTRDSEGILAINDSVYNFNTGDVAEIRLSKKPLRVVKLK